MNNETKRKNIEQTILAHVKKLKSNEQVKEIDSLIEFLEFERRFAQLTPEEKEQMYDTLLSELSSDDFQNITTIQNVEKRRELLTERARVLYQERPGWFDCLHSHTTYRPPRSSDR